AALPASQIAHAQPYPHKPIRMIVPFPAAGATDILARVVSQKLSEAVRQQVIVDNRAGAGGTLGSRLAADAPPDGYTLLFSTVSTHAIGPSLYSKRPYDALKDFAAITEVATSPTVLMVAASVPVSSTKELIALAKAKPGQLNFGSSGIGTQFHLSGELLKLLAGIDIVHVPYKGTALVYPDMFSGQIAMLWDVPIVALPFIKAGRVKALGVSGRKRAPVLPDVPTIAEAGVQGYDADLWFGMWGPAKLPTDRAMLMQRQVATLMQAPDTQRRFAELGAEPVGSTPEAFKVFLAGEITKWEKVVKASGARND
ncbi:MAG TPA: tripartite tricarboxylate transporter substrate binding protein, partial [Burkholderiales bacterium]|nr:tripartite tricarboxylate transporter substrate binding protein [Burkholderiales bacterium]